jgi:hypothetical protein
MCFLDLPIDECAPTDVLVLLDFRDHSIDKRVFFLYNLDPAEKDS